MTTEPRERARRRGTPAVVICLCLALVLGAGIVTALVLPAASQRTSILRHPVMVTVTAAGASAVPGHDGQVLHPGDLVTVGRGGGGEIATGSRKLLLAGDGTAVFLDGPASTEVRSGSVVAIDDGRDWSLRADQVAVSHIHGAVRIDYGFTTRVAAYSGSATLDVPTGAAAGLAGLDQLAAAGGILPERPSPLQLDDDALDAAAAPGLVTLDRGLTALAAEIDADPQLATEAASTAASTGAPVTASERILPVAIGAAGTGGSAASRVHSAAVARERLGSWGTIARLAGASLPKVRSQLASMLDGSTKGAEALAAGDSAALRAVTAAALGTALPGGISPGGTLLAGAGDKPAAAPSPESSPAPSPGLTASPSPAGATSGVSAGGNGGGAGTAGGTAGATPTDPVSRPVTKGPVSTVVSTVGTASPAHPVATSASPARPGTAGNSPTPAAKPTVTPQPAATPVLSLLLDTVGGLLPTSNPLPVTLRPSSSAPTPSAAAPSPTPLVSGLVTTVTGLLGGH